MSVESSHNPFIVRDAIETDLAACLVIDRAYLTEHVWQMEMQTDDERVAVIFRAVRLPRPMRVVSTPDIDLLHSLDCLLVAAEGETMLGYLGMRADAARAHGWVVDLVVTPARRRQGIGGALLKAAFVWSREHGLGHITVETQTKNFPGICFCQKYGLAFCGFNDKYYPNQDIALFFDQRVR
ncbi:MAG: GNAT family N-acetyltransferase [Anaerolineae bacterium]|nr:GNAT family N-acetyltransferase [Anaerolineae bacterium]